MSAAVYCVPSTRGLALGFDYTSLCFDGTQYVERIEPVTSGCDWRLCLLNSRRGAALITVSRFFFSNWRLLWTESFVQLATCFGNYYFSMTQFCTRLSQALD